LKIINQITVPGTKVIDVKCQCGQDIARYEKVGRGTLRKMYLDKILTDHTGRFLIDPPLPNGTQIQCPSCNKRIATIQMIHGRPAAKMNQGTIKKVKT
jgi:hypothetical protein